MAYSYVVRRFLIQGMLHFIAQSDVLGKTLFVILVLMSLVSWYLIFAKSFMNWRVRRRSAQKSPEKSP